MANYTIEQLRLKKLEIENQELRQGLFDYQLENRQLRETLATIGYLLQRGDYLDKILTQPRPEKSTRADFMAGEFGIKTDIQPDWKRQEEAEATTTSASTTQQPIKTPPKPRAKSRQILRQEIEREELERQQSQQQGSEAQQTTTENALEIAKQVYQGKRININLKKQEEEAAKKMEGEDGDEKLRMLEEKERQKA